VFTLNLKFTLLLAWYYGIRTIARGPSYIIAALSTPLALLFLVYVLSGGALVKYALVGGFIAIVASVALQSSGDAAFFRLQLRIQDLYVASSVSPSDYMIGLTLSYLMFSLPGIALYGILGVIYHLFSLSAILMLILVLALLVLATSSISFIISSSIKHIRNIWGIAGILSVLMTILPPTYYPYESIKRVFLYILSITPVTPAAVVAQYSFGLSPALPVELYVLIGETIIFFAMARFLTRWREK
jgi:ABC-2 type transport system permease protein